MNNTRTATPQRKALAAMIVAVAGLSVGASACGSDDDTDDPGTPTETLDDMTDSTVADMTATTLAGGVPTVTTGD